MPTNKQYAVKYAIFGARRRLAEKEKGDGPWKTWLSKLGCLALFACIFPVFGLVLLALFICGSVVYLLGSIVSLVIPKKHSRIFLFFALAFFCFTLLYSVWLRQPTANKKDDTIDNPIVFSKGETIIQLKNRFKLFKKNKILLSKRQFADILDKNSPGLVPMLKEDWNNGAIVIKSTNNFKYIHFIEVGSKFKVISWNEEKKNWVKSQERISEGRVDISINHKDFIYYNKTKIEDEIIVNSNAPGFQYEIYPEDIKYEIQQLGVIIMQNSLENFSQNNFEEYFIDSTTFFSFFPESILIKLFERNIASATELLEEEYDWGVGNVIIDSVESQIAIENTELDLNENIIYNPIIKDNARKLILESIEQGLITNEDIANLLSENKAKKIRKFHVKRLIKLQNKMKRSE